MEGNKKILITGGSGFIGGFITNEAIKRGNNVYVTVRKSTNIDNLKNKNINIVEIDFSDVADLNYKILNLPQFDYIIHNAGLTKALKRHDYFEVNYRNTIHFINALTTQQKAPEKFLYMSSLAAYGPGDENATNPVLLTSLPAPLTSYGQSKLYAEKVITASGIPYIIFRPTAVYGPGEKDLFESIKLINKGIDFQIGIKNQHLTFIYVKDLARLVLDAIESPISNKAYFISDSNLYSNIEWGKYVSENLNKKNMHVAVPLFLAKGFASINELLSRILKKATVLNREKISELAARNWNCDVQELSTDFCFEAEYDLEKGLNETIAWYKKAGWLK
jgi:UDP-glucose 4-epimerase